MKNITEAQWYSQPSYQSDLKALLDNPVMEAALQVAFDQGFKTIPALATPGGDLVDYFAIQGAVREGYRLAFQKLRDLTQPKVSRPTTQPKPWESSKETK